LFVDADPVESDIVVIAVSIVVVVVVVVGCVIGKTGGWWTIVWHACRELLAIASHCAVWISDIVFSPLLNQKLKVYSYGK